MRLPNGRLGRPLCVMVGPDPSAQGGMAGVAAALVQAGLFADATVLYLSSTRPGSRFAKLWNALTAWMQYMAVLMRGGGAVLHVHVASRVSFWRKAVFIWSACLAHRQIVLQMHGGAFREFFESLPPLTRALALATIRQADVSLCLSTQDVNWLRNLTPDAAVRWWPNPVPAELFGIGETTARREPVLLYLGALLPAKGLDDLLLAFAQLHAAKPEARLVIGGVGPELHKLQGVATKLGLVEVVDFPGWLGSAEKLVWLGRARVLALASRVEAQPMVLLEAMAAGVAVVSTRVGGVPDLIADGETGLLVSAGQTDQLSAALLRLWVDNGLRSNLVRRARSRVADIHRADHVCDALLTIYWDLARYRQLDT